MTGTRPGEFDIIARYFAPIAASFPGALGLRDDAAVFRPPPGADLVVTVDAMVAGVHFLPDDPPDLIARKLMRVNLSDLAAKGAKPYACFLALSLPGTADEPWLAAFAEGLAADAAEFALPLAGGDTTATPGPVTLSLTAIGTVAEGRGAILRSGARPGDIVYVTGTIGDAHLGLAVQRGESSGLAAEHRAALIGRYRLPQPRVGFGGALAALGRDMIHAAADVSDGLVADLGHICKASGFGARLRAADVPLSAAAEAALAAEGSTGLLPRLLTGGDDYEIVFTAAPGAGPALRKLAAEQGLRVSAIGEITQASGIEVVGADGRILRLDTAGYRHF